MVFATMVIVHIGLMEKDEDMKLIENKKVFFDAISHSYINDKDELLIGVTSLLEKHNLAPDLSNIPATRLKEAADKGTRVHEYLQSYEAGKMVLPSGLLNEYKKLGLRFLASEFLVSDNELVASKIDMLYQSGPDSVIIADIKTSEKKNLRYVTWQTSIYKVLFERQNPGIKVSDLYLIWTDKNCEKLKAFERLEPIPESEVEALLDAERKDEIYVDPYQPKSASIVLSDSELQTYVNRISTIAELKEKLKEYEAFVKTCDSKILAYMLENNLEIMSVSDGTIKLKKGYQRKTVDTAKLAKDYPQLAAKYEKISEVSPSIIYKSDN